MAYGQKAKTGPRAWSFPASYDGDCPAGDSIDQGEQIVMVDYRAWHAQCAEAEGCNVVEGDQ